MLKFKTSGYLEQPDNGEKKRVFVLKISCNGKFLIFKATSIEWVQVEISKVYGKYQRGGILETNLMYPFVKWVHKQDRKKILIEVIFASNNGYEVLKFELNQLIEHFGRPECLNANNVPHIPKTEVAKKGSGWLTQNEALNFRKLLTKYNY